MRAQLRCQESMAKHCVSAASSEASATTAVVAASMAAAVRARKQSSVAAWSHATADTGWWRSGRRKKARSRSPTVSRHPGKSSEHRRYKYGYIADSASSSGLDSCNSISDAITWKHRESRGESIREGEDRSSNRGEVTLCGSATLRLGVNFARSSGFTQRR